MPALIGNNNIPFLCLHRYIEYARRLKILTWYKVMVETSSNFLRSRSAEEARTDSSFDASIVDETQKDKNDLSQSLLSEFLQTAPTRIQRSGQDLLLASNDTAAPSFASAVGGQESSRTWSRCAGTSSTRGRTKPFHRCSRR